jgi:hypothetical protein
MAEQHRRRAGRPGWALAPIAALALFLVSAGTAMAGGPAGCPPMDTGDPAGPTCSVQAEPVGDDVTIDRFSPNSNVTVEIRDSDGSRLHDPVTVRTDARGVAGFDPSRLRTQVNLAVGQEVIVTDERTSTVKRLVVARVRVTSVDVAAETMSGTAQPAARVVVFYPPAPGEPGRASADVAPDGSWAVHFQGADITSSTELTVVAFDADGDTTRFQPVGCPRSPGAFNCTLDVHIDGDFVFAGMSPNSEVTTQIFAARGGALLLGPVTMPTDDNGFIAGIEPFDSGVDIAPGNFIVARDAETGTVRELELPAVFIDRVDPATDVVEGRAPPGAEVGVAASEGEGLSVTADAAGNWSVNFAAAFGRDITSNTAAAAIIVDEDGDSARATRGAPLLDCLAGPDTVCGTAGPEALRTTGPTGTARAVAAGARTRRVKAGGGNDTVLVAIGARGGTVSVDTGTGDEDKVAVRANARAARSLAVIRGRSRQMTVALPVHAGNLSARITGTNGPDTLRPRGRRRGGGSSGRYRVDGRGGHDVLTTGDGADIISGGTGNDILNGGRGRDTINGGPGRDLCIADPGDRVRSCETVRRRR